VSRKHLLTAIQTTLLNALTPTGLQTRSHNVHSELLLSLSPNNNITDSIRRHGLSDKTTGLLVVRIEPESGDEKSSQEAAWGRIEEVVKGRLVSLDVLDDGSLVDWAKTDKVGCRPELLRISLTLGRHTSSVR
jgi:EKC/KEOPS complex subunit CGI121/TPRKB